MTYYECSIGKVCRDAALYGKDADGNGCDVYTGRGDCGARDDADFNAKSMCCSCGGGILGNLTRVKLYEIHILIKINYVSNSGARGAPSQTVVSLRDSEIMVPILGVEISGR